jgi:hypothetical protein
MTRKDEPYVKRTITMVGDTTSDEPCEVCQEADAYLTPLVERDKRIEYIKKEVSTPEGEKYADAKKVSSIPYFEDCRYTEGSDKPSCKRIKGFDETDWSDLKEIVDKPVEVKTDEQPATTEDKAE